MYKPSKSLKRYLAKNNQKPLTHLREYLARAGVVVPSRPISIYVIVDAMDNVMYVGATSASLRARMAAHRRERGNAAKWTWLQDNPEARAVLVTRVAKRDWRASESDWIVWGMGKGRLLNANSGPPQWMSKNPRRVTTEAQREAKDAANPPGWMKRLNAYRASLVVP